MVVRGPHFPLYIKRFISLVPCLHCKYFLAILHCLKAVALMGISEIVRKICAGITMFVFSDYYF